MARKKQQASEDVANSQPTSITELQPIVEEFLKRYNQVKQEQELLKEDEKALVAEFSSKLDTKTLKFAMKSVEIKTKVEHKDSFDNMVEVLERIGL
jgi:hypothetical protein